MKLLWLFLLCLPFAMAQTFTVGLTIYPCSADFNAYEQLTAAELLGQEIQLRTPVNVTANGTCVITIPAQFQAATNFTILKNTTDQNATVNVNSVTWNATNGSHWLTYNASPPVANTTTTTSSGTYRLDITLRASTSLRNSSYWFTVPQTATDFTLQELLNGTVDRTLTYELAINGTNATFTNVFYTETVLERTLILSATMPSSSGGSNPRSNVYIQLPTTLQAERGTSATAIIAVENQGYVQTTITLKYNNDDLSTNPQQIIVPPRTTAYIDLIYSPTQLSREQTVLVQAIADGKSITQQLITLVPLEPILPKPKPVTTPTPEQNQTNTYYAFIRTPDGTIIQEATVPQGTPIADALDTRGLSPGTYELCTRSESADTDSERCSPTYVPTPVQEQIAQPLPPATTPNQIFLLVAILVPLALLIAHFLFKKVW